MLVTHKTWNKQRHFAASKCHTYIQTPEYWSQTGPGTYRDILLFVNIILQNTGQTIGPGSDIDT